MPFVGLFLLSWCAWLTFAAKSKWRLFLPSCLLAMIMSLTSDVLIHKYTLWGYTDTTHLFRDMDLNYWDDYGIYPVVTYLFLQFFPYGRNMIHKFTYFVLWTTGTIALEWLFLKMGWMTHQHWWTLLCSYAADWLILYGLYRFHLLYQREEAGSPARYLHKISALGPGQGRDACSKFKMFCQNAVLFEIEPHSQIPVHTHTCDELVYMLQGSLSLTYEGNTHTLHSGDRLCLPAGVPHSAHNELDERIVLVSVFTPPGQPGNPDPYPEKKLPIA